MWFLAISGSGNRGRRPGYPLVFIMLYINDSLYCHVNQTSFLLLR